MPAKKIYSDEMVEYLREIAPDRFLAELTRMMNEHFGTDFTERQIKELKKENHIRSGNGHWRKGHCDARSIPTQFKKGIAPKNKKPVGTITMSSDGYKKIKIGEPSKWAVYHKYLWEQAYGKVPEGYCLIFKDGNREHTTLDNLAMVTLQERLILNRRNLINGTDESITLAKLMARVYELKNDKGKNNGKEND